MMMRTISLVSLSVSILEMKVRSIFNVSAGNPCKRLSEEYPVPKSSMLM